MNRLQEAVEAWHKKAFTGRHELKIAKKTLEEASELHIAVKQECSKDRVPGKLKMPRSIRDEIGDTLLCLAVLTPFYQDSDLEEIGWTRFEEIKQRTDQQERDEARGIA